MPFETLNLIKYVNLIYFMTGSPVASPTVRARQRHKDIFTKVFVKQPLASPGSAIYISGLGLDNKP